MPYLGLDDGDQVSVQGSLIEKAVVLAGFYGNAKHADDGRVRRQRECDTVFIQETLEFGASFRQQFESHRGPCGRRGERSRRDFEASVRCNSSAHTSTMNEKQTFGLHVI